MLFKLALRNVKRQISNYVIYFITVTFIVALIFSINNFIFSDVLAKIEQDTTGTFLKQLFAVVTTLLCIIIAFFLSYVTAFLVGRRKKEFGLYLTLGMTRGNILCMFMGETLVSFLLSFGCGVALGIGVYHAIMAMFINFIQVEYAVKTFSASAFAVTAVMVVGIFFISSAVSLLYLRFVKISRLLNGEKTVEKTGKRPLLWFCLAAVGLALIIIAFVLIFTWLAVDYMSELEVLERFVFVFGAIITFIAGVIIAPVGIAKGAMPVLIRRNEKTFSAKGTAVFTMRQLSGRMNSNSVMTGLLCFFLAFAIVVPNIFLMQNAIIAERVKQDYPFDVNLYYDYGLRYDADLQIKDCDEEVELIEKYAEIKNSYSFKLYYSAEQTGNLIEPDFSNEDSLISESDFNKLCVALGREPVNLNGGYYVMYHDDTPREIGDFENMPLTVNGVSYRNAGSEKIVNRIFYSTEVLNAHLIVVPDSAVQIAPSENLFLHANGLGVMLKSHRYDAFGLQDEFNELRGNLPVFNYYNFIGISQECVRLSEVQEIALWLLGCLFVSAMFILLSMLLLALKMLTMMEEDRIRYRTLWRIGADKGMIFKSLFMQTFIFFFLPFLLPLLISLPYAAVLFKAVALQGVQFGLLSIFGQVLGFTGLILLLYALYFTATYLIARRDVRKTLQSFG